MDHFDHEENTKSGIDGSHDTSFMFFQNGEDNDETNVSGISVKPESRKEKKAFSQMLDCQKLIRTRKLVSHGQIPENFVPEEPNETKDIQNESNADYVTWVMVRYVTKTNLPEYSSCEKPNIPSFTATYSVLIHKHCPLTRIGFTPIIPYLATEYDTHP